MQTGFIDKLDSLREEVGFRLRVTSGYRCPRHNARVSSTGLHGPHTTGRAVDLAVDRERAYEVLSWIEHFGFTGIGLNQKGEGRFIHLDDLPHASGQPRPTVWTY
jgi:uncharacterized protein YcbK (DUF882 family)